MTARRLPFPAHVKQAVRYQPERWDGRCYAFDVKGDATPVPTRALTQADRAADPLAALASLP